MREIRGPGYWEALESYSFRPTAIAADEWDVYDCLHCDFTNVGRLGTVVVRFRLENVYPGKGWRCPQCHGMNFFDAYVEGV